MPNFACFPVDENQSFIINAVQQKEKSPHLYLFSLLAGLK